VVDLDAAAADPALAGDRMGPLVSGDHRDGVPGFIAGAVAQGARVAAGGPSRPAGRERGHHARSTILAGVTADITVWREEVFGPFFSITPSDTEAETVALADDDAYGLTAHLQTGNPDRMACALRRGGQRQRPGPAQGLRRGSPFGGYGASVNGRESGALCIEEFP
jgi:aldehyde dehydrogenase (NAD+)